MTTFAFTADVVVAAIYSSCFSLERFPIFDVWTHFLVECVKRGRMFISGGDRVVVHLNIQWLKLLVAWSGGRWRWRWWCYIWMVICIFIALLLKFRSQWSSAGCFHQCIHVYWFVYDHMYVHAFSMYWCLHLVALCYPNQGNRIRRNECMRTYAIDFIAWWILLWCVTATTLDRFLLCDVVVVAVLVRKEIKK